MDDEATIQINGKQLSVAQSIAVRMPCTTFLMEMSDDGALGEDEHGKTMVANYRGRLSEVMDLINR